LQTKYEQLKLLKSLPSKKYDKKLYNKLKKICGYTNGKKSDKNGKKSGKKGKDNKKINQNDMELFRILANGIEDKGGYENNLKDNSLWNKICGKMRKVILDKMIKYLNDVNNIEKQSIISVKMSGIEIWPIIFYKDTISNILTRHLGREDEINDNVQNKESIKNQLNSKSEFDNLQNSLSSDEIKSSIANYLYEKISR
jgi:hypothetical protein